MSVEFTVPSKTRIDTFRDTVSLGDVESYIFDFTPWEEDNVALTTATWNVESGTGNVAITSQSLVSGILSATLTFNQAGVSLISILASSASFKKKIWLEVRVRDNSLYTGDDYGHCCC